MFPCTHFAPVSKHSLGNSQAQEIAISPRTIPRYNMDTNIISVTEFTCVDSKCTA